jgi:hypothetical protein
MKHSSDISTGYLFLKKLAQNQPGIQPGGDEVDAAYQRWHGSSSRAWVWLDWLRQYETTLDGN